MVGPGEKLTRIEEAAKIAKDGDVVLIKAGIYENDVAVWMQKRLEIRGVGGRPVLVANGADAEGKAIWVIRNGEFHIQNIEFRGARVEDGNGAGIRFEQGSLSVDDCVFNDNQMGILTSNTPDAQLRIINSEFSNAPHQMEHLHHLLYVGKIARFSIEGSRLHQGFRGHLLKSRARVTEIAYNLIVDGEGGEASYEIDLPNGGDALIIGNVIAQSATSGNPVVLAYGAEGGAWPLNRLLISHNTMISDGWRPAWFARVWKRNLPADFETLAVNNLTVGLGVFTLLLPGEHRGNYFLPPNALDPAALDMVLSSGSLLRGRASTIQGPLAQKLTPIAEFALPRGTMPLSAPKSWAPGAFQSSAPVFVDGTHAVSPQ